MKICIFPNDPIIEYFKKGEIKERYYNPKNFFDKIHIISLSENDIEESKVQTIAGNAKLIIHSVGRANIKNKKYFLQKIENLVKEIKPDIIRAYSPYLTGWFAAKCSENLKIPFYLSLHTNYDYNRNLAKKTNLKKYFSLKFTEKFIEPYVLQKASKITIIYKIIEPYVLKNGGVTPEVLHNKVDFKRFANAMPKDDLTKPLIISVGNLIPEKNHQCLINAMQTIDAHCIIIGDGVEHDNLIRLIEKKNLQNKIKIISSVPHDEIHMYYKASDVFALAYDPNIESLPMPVMEAMATGIPVIIPKPVEGYSEGLENIAVFSDPEPESFAENIKNVLMDQDLYKKLAISSQKKAKEFDSQRIEIREAEIYQEIISKNL